jgi:hypothetical protein
MYKRIVAVGLVGMILMAVVVTVLARELQNRTLGAPEAATAYEAPANNVLSLAQVQVATAIPTPIPTLVPTLIPTLIAPPVATVAAGAQPAAQPVAGMDLKVFLAGSAAYPTVVGDMEYDVNRRGGAEIKVEVHNAVGLVGQVLDVYVDGALIGRMLVDGRGRAEFEVDSDWGQAIPAVTTGSTVEVRLGNAVVTSGQFNTAGGSAPNGNANAPNKVFLVAGAAHPGLRGDGEFDVDRRGNTELDVEVNNAVGLVGQVLDIYVDGALIGRMIVDGRGQAEFKTDSEWGQIVPAVATGSTVEVRLGNDVVASGQFNLVSNNVGDWDDDDDDDDWDDD